MKGHCLALALFVPARAQASPGPDPSLSGEPPAIERRRRGYALCGGPAETFAALSRQGVKTIVGTSADALKIQTRTALISILLIQFLPLRSRLGGSLSPLRRSWTAYESPRKVPG